MVQVIKDAMGTKGARVTTDISLPGRFLVLMPFSEFVGVSRRSCPTTSASGCTRSSRRYAPAEASASSCAPSRRAHPSATSHSDLEFLLRLWKRVNHQSTEALAPEVIYTEMDLALRLVRDVFSEEFRRLVIDDRATFEKVTSFLKKTSPQLVAKRAALQRPAALFETYDLQATIDSALCDGRSRCRAAAT